MDLDANKKFFLIWFMNKLLNKTYSTNIPAGATIYTDHGIMVYTGFHWISAR